MRHVGANTSSGASKEDSATQSWVVFVQVKDAPGVLARISVLFQRFALCCSRWAFGSMSTWDLATQTWTYGGFAVGEMERPPAEAGDRRDDSELSYPWCGATRSERLGEFGPQLLSAQYICLDCGSPFEVIRSRGEWDTGR